MSSWGIKLAAVAIAAGLVFWLLPPPERRREVPPIRRQQSSARIGPLEAESLKGREVFGQLDDRVTFKERSHPYPAMLLWAAEIEPEGGDVFRASDARFLVNRKPGSEEELGSLVQIDPSLPVNLIGPSLEKQREKVLWVRAPKALLVGGHRLAELRALRLLGPVRASVPESWSPVGAVDARLEGVEVALREGTPDSATAPGVVSFRFEGGRLDGRDLRLDFARESATLKEDISIVLERMKGMAPGLLPLKVRGKGPLELVPGTAEGREGPLELRLSGPVVVDYESQGLQARGRELTVFLSGVPRTIERIELRDEVVLAGPQGRFSGDLLSYHPSREGRDRLKLGGSLVKGRMERGAGVFPMASKSGPLDIETPGSIELLPAQGGKGDEYLIGPELSLESGGSRLTVGGHARFEVVRIAAGRGGLDTKGRGVLRRLRLDGGVEGEDARSAFECATLEYERLGARIERPEGDRLVFGGEASLRFAVGTPHKGKSKDPHRLEVEGQRIAILRDPLGLKPTEVEAEGWVNARWASRSKGGPRAQWKEGAWLQGGELRALLDTTSGGPAGGSAQLRLKWMRLRQRVVLQEPQGSELHCHEMELDDLRGRLVATPQDGERVLARLVDEKGKTRRISGRRVELESGLQRVTVTGEALAELELPTLDTVSVKRWFALGPELPAKVRAGEIRVGFVGWGASLFPRQARVQHLSALGKVSVVQPESRMDCTRLESDLAHRSVVVDGDPLVFVVTRGGESETIRCSSLVAREKTLLLRGAVNADLLTPPLLVGKEAQDLVLTHLETKGDLLFANEQIVLSEAARLTQGKLDGDGCSLAARKIFVTLRAPKPKGRRGVHSATARGEVVFRTRSMVGRGDELVYSRRASALSLTHPLGKATLELEGIVQAPRPRWDVDLSEPSAPRIISVARPHGGGR